MDYSRKLLPPMVSSAIALIAVTNYCIVHILATSKLTAAELFTTILPIAFPTSVAVILVMSALYHKLQEVLDELDRKQSDLLVKAQRDTLTGLANRDLFEEQLRQALVRYRRTGERFAVAMLDLDHFKRVNDLHGHQTGDELLKMAASRLQAQLRDGDTVARFGGDEFLVLQTGLSGLAGVRRLCRRISEKLREPYAIGSLQLQLPASIGVVVANRQLQSPSDFVRAADMALYDAKAQGRNCIRFFSEELDERLRRRDELETDLRSAVQSGSGIAVHFQPQISAGGTVTGVEALFRWNHPRLGEIPATEAVEIAEESDIIEDLGEFVFREAAKFARGHCDLSVAVNVSPAQFSRSENFATRMREMAEREGIETSQIEFEITERLFVTVGSGSDSQVQCLRDYGFRVALDDFGTGYSSLSYLRRFKVDRLKLDRSFAATADAQENIALVRAAVSLAHLLNLEVIAEGIETELQESVALESGCDVLQGHRYGAPMTSDEFDKFMDERSRRAA